MPDHRLAQSPVRHQGDRPICVAFAVSAAHEWMATDDAQLSAEDALWAGHQILCIPGREETSVAAAVQGIAVHEHASEVAGPYGQPAFPADRPAAAQQGSNRKILPPWRALPNIAVATISRELDRPAAIMLTVRFVYGAWRPDDGVIDAAAGKKTIANHAVLAVGLDEKTPTSVIIKNSWGTRWGDRGYGYISERYLEGYALRAYALEAA